MRCLLVAVLLSLLSISLAADEQFEASGNAFVRQCSVVEKEHDLTKRDIALREVCAAYVSGFVEGVGFGISGARSNSGPATPYPFCGVEQAEAGQIVKIVLRYIREHPETAHLPAYVLSGRALQQAFPCK